MTSAHDRCTVFFSEILRKKEIKNFLFIHCKQKVLEFFLFKRLTRLLCMLLHFLASKEEQLH